MITLDQVSILTPGVFRRHPILVDTSATFGRGERVGILAYPGTGKTSIARLLAGIDQPDRGVVRAEGRVSWPIGFAGFLHPKLRVRDNLGIFARLMGMTPETVTDFCVEFCSIDGLPDRLMQDITPTQRALLAYACALSVPGPATWIADEVISVGQARERARCDEVLSDRLKTGSLIFLSRNVGQLKRYCDRFFVLINRRLVACADIETAQEALELTLANPTTGH